MSIGVPVKLFHEAAGHMVTIELMSGEVYRGTMTDAEDNMNCQMKDTTCTAKDGRQTLLQHVYIRGSQIRFMVLPDMLKNAPMFKRVEAQKAGKKAVNLGVGRGRAAAMRAAGGGGRGRAGGPGGARGRGRGF